MYIQQPITGETLIRNLPITFINFLSTTFNPDNGNNWKNLVSLYNWNFGQIQAFRNRHHQEGIFCSLLQEGEFQQYKIKDLQLDLEDIPRLDALADLNIMICEHNSAL